MNITYIFSGIYATGDLTVVREAHRRAILKEGYTILSDHPPTNYEASIPTDLIFGERVVPSSIEKVLLDENYVQKCDTIPSYNSAKCNGVIAMNPYSRGRAFMRSKTIVDSRKVGMVNVSDGPVMSLGPGDKGAGYFKTLNPGGYAVDSVYTYTVQARLTGLVPFVEKYRATGPDASRIPVIDTANLETGVFTSLMASVAKSDFDIATNVAESKATIEGFATLLPKLFDDMSKLRRLATRIPKGLMEGRMAKWQLKKALLEAPEVVADYRLLWRYGIQPVYLSSLDLLKALNNKSQPLFQTVRDGDSINFEIPGWSGTITLKAHGVWKGKFELASSETKRYSLYVPTAMYELVPYSVVVDWFVNLGDIIAAVRPLPTQISNSCISTKCEADLKWYTTVAVQNRSGVVSQNVNFGPKYGLYRLSGKLTVTENKFDVETGRYYAQTFRRGQGRVGLSTNTDLTLNQSLDALAMLWKQLAKRRRHSFWSV